MVQLKWLGKLAFEADPPSGNKFTFDAHPESGGENKGPTPVEALLGSLAACAAIDVVSILEKKRQIVTAYHIEIDGDRPPEGQYPRPLTAIRIKHILRGQDLDPVAVARALQLSDEKYCSVLATLRTNPTVTTTWEIEPMELSVGQERTAGS